MTTPLSSQQLAEKIYALAYSLFADSASNADVKFKERVAQLLADNESEQLRQARELLRRASLMLGGGQVSFIKRDIDAFLNKTLNSGATQGAQASGAGERTDAESLSHPLAVQSLRDEAYEKGRVGLAEASARVSAQLRSEASPEPEKTPLRYDPLTLGDKSWREIYYAGYKLSRLRNGNERKSHDDGLDGVATEALRRSDRAKKQPPIDKPAPFDVPKLLNEIPELTSLLYDLNLLPEQIDTRDDQVKMFFICAHFKAISERYAKAALASIAALKEETRQTPERA